MSQPAVVFDGVWKKFRRGERHDSLRDLIPSLVRRASRGRAATDLDGTDEFWALRDVSFEVHPGEALGIIGPNGAGKSTTLKLLTKILKPTRGQALVRGRVGAMIEVAAGFHPDLTGRENIFLQGAIMGMKRTEVARKLDEIIDFAGVAEFVDTPVKRYSSGMNARLGFSIAAHLEPEVLIVDEVLSVGDTAFQERCLERMFAFRQMGTTIVFVSHDLQAIATLCSHALYLERETKAIGPAADVLASYVQNASRRQSDDKAAAVSVIGASLIDIEDSKMKIAPGTSLTLRVDYDVRRALEDITLGMILYRSTDHEIAYEATIAGKDIGFPSQRKGSVSVDFSFSANLTRGQYHVECYVIHTPTHEYLSRLSPAAILNISETRTCRGIADIGLRASINEPIFS